MSENIITKVENVLSEAAAGIKHDAQVLLNALKELFAHHQEVTGTKPEIAASQIHPDSLAEVSAATGIPVAEITGAGGIVAPTSQVEAVTAQEKNPTDVTSK
jgi:hypothetical protein